MEFIYIVLAIILIETSYLVLVNKKKLATKTVKRNIYVDTSVLIDGRIVSIAQTGFLGGVLQIPKSVVAELQLLADGSDSTKRNRARYGLDVIKDLQALNGVDVNILQDHIETGVGVDDQLINLAKADSGSVICTLDYNLNKVATVEGVKVLNINDLALSLRLRYLPGERITVHLMQKGQEAQQAVGNTADGTMVVVEKAAKKIGHDVEIEVTSSLQTTAGKMVFGKLVTPVPQKASNRSHTNNKNNHKQAGKAKQKTNAKKVTNKLKSKPKTQEDRLLELVNSK